MSPNNSGSDPLDIRKDLSQWGDIVFIRALTHAAKANGVNVTELAKWPCPKDEIFLDIAGTKIPFVPVIRSIEEHLDKEVMEKAAEIVKDALWEKVSLVLDTLDDVHADIRAYFKRMSRKILEGEK